MARENRKAHLRYFRSVFEIVLSLILVSSIIVYTFQTIRNPPTGINVDFTTISISLAGFCLVAASFNKTEKVKNELYRGSALFIYASAAFIVFYMTLTLENLIKQLELHIFFYIVVGLSILFASIEFSSGIIRLLRAIRMAELFNQ